jgi:hypothetical protein
MKTFKHKMTPEDARRDHSQMLRFMALNAAIGVGLGLLVTALIIVLDIGGIGTRIAHARSPLLPILLIAVPLASMFGGAVTASAIWLMPYERKFAPEREEKKHDNPEDPDRQSR